MPNYTGGRVEWHLVRGKSFEEISFDFMPGLHLTIVFLLPAFSQARLKATRTVGNGMSCDGIQQLFVYAPAECSVTLALQCDQWLKCLERLDRAFEADQSWFHIVFAGHLSDDRADPIVSQDSRDRDDFSMKTIRRIHDR